MKKRTINGAAVRATIKENDARLGRYDYPGYLKKIAALICMRFAISGICDPGYICSRIIHACCGYETDTIPEGSEVKQTIAEHAETCADALMSAYGWNIRPEDQDNLLSILKTGSIEYTEHLPGIQRFFRRLDDEASQDSTDEIRLDYLSGCRKNLQYFLASFESNWWTLRKENVYIRYLLVRIGQAGKIRNILQKNTDNGQNEQITCDFPDGVSMQFTVSCQGNEGPKVTAELAKNGIPADAAPVQGTEIEKEWQIPYNGYIYVVCVRLEDRVYSKKRATGKENKAKPYPANLLRDVCDTIQNADCDAALSYLDEHHDTVTEEQARALADTISVLPERSRQILDMYYREKLTLRDIGSRIGISAEQVRHEKVKSLTMIRHSIGKIMRQPANQENEEGKHMENGSFN